MSGFKTAFKLATATTVGAMSALVLTSEAFADDTKYGPAGSAGDTVSKFRQLDHVLPTPNIYRNASGAPGPAYWQQSASHTMDIRLDEDERRIYAESDIEYTNNSPDDLNYIWLALDQNRFKDGSLEDRSATAAAAGSRRGDGSSTSDRYSFTALRKHQAKEDRTYGGH